MATKENVQTLAARSARRTLDWIEELVQEAAFLRKQESHGTADWLEHHVAEHLIQVNPNQPSDHVLLSNSKR